MEPEIANRVNVRIDLPEKKISNIFAASLAGVVLVIGIILAGAISPNIVNTLSYDVPQCTPGNLSQCISPYYNQKLSFEILGLEKPNQLLYFSVEPYSSEKIKSELRVNYILYVKKAEEYEKKLIKDTNITIDCSENSCKTRPIIYIPYIDYKDYLIAMEVDRVPIINGLKFYSTTINSDFSLFVISLKYIFFTLSISNLIYFIIHVRNIPVHNWRFESKSIFLMNLSLVVFNDPFSAISIVNVNPKFSSISVFCNTQFIVSLMLFWLLSFQYSIKFKLKIFLYCCELMGICIFYFLIFKNYLYATINFRYDPTYKWSSRFTEVSKEQYTGLIVLLSLFGIIGMIFSILNLIKYPTLLFIEKIYKISNALMMIFTFVFIGFGFLQPVPRQACLVMIVIVIFNVYFMLLLWFFRPDKECYDMMGRNMSAEFFGIAVDIKDPGISKKLTNNSGGLEESSIQNVKVGRLDGDLDMTKFERMVSSK
ncbi:hypothetical protein SteCoe_37828 [Stentor coeruleus]|uniref:Wntless-like transmembrane domain-containing protein n=1 Tax=Stentor coeruleus TaxID=5963 RepID=A0A1R2AMC6_9CILI|nr:hypothetical protein SteCoe_37828 [Stentor coeruleus]